MAVTLKGLGVVWGVGTVGATASAAIIDSDKAKVQSAQFGKSAGESLLKDEKGETVGAAIFNKRHEFTITCIPVDPDTATGIADAKVNLQALLPAIGTKVTITDSESTIVDGTHSGEYIVTAVSNGRTNNGFATITMSLRQYVATNISATITA